MNQFNLDGYDINPEMNLGSGPSGEIYEGICKKNN